MQAKACHNIIPPKLLPPAKLPSTASHITLPSHVPRAITITTSPTHEVYTPVPEIDDTITAFWDYQFLFVSQRSEATEPITLRVVEGAIPTDFPSGKYYLTGPGLFADDHGSTVHPLDGHGYLRTFEIDGGSGQVKFMARYIETEAQAEERDPVTGKWRFTHRGPFSVLKGGKMVGNTKVMKNVANTSVLQWGGRLFCLWEGGDPYEIDSKTLKTVGKFELINNCKSLAEQKKLINGDFLDVAAQILKPILYGVFKMPPKRLLSHYKIDARRNRLLIASCNAEDMLLPRSNFTFYEFDSNFQLLQSQEFDIPDHLMIHDWAFTDTHYILFGNRIKLDIPGSMTAVCGLSPMISALSVNPSKATSPIYLLPRFSDHNQTNNIVQRDWRKPIEAPTQMWVLHVGNAFEEKDENGNVNIQIQASGCSYQWFNFQKMFGYDWQSGKLDPSMMNVEEGEEKLLPHLVQVSISLDTNGNCTRSSVNDLNTQWNKAADFPAMNPDYSGKKNEYVYAATSSGSRQALPHFPFDTVVKLNTADKSVRKWSAGRRRFIGEPVFIPRGITEDDGYLLVVEYAVSTQRCYLVILDAQIIGEKNEVVARLEVPRHLNFPLGFHGFWAPSNTGQGNLPNFESKCKDSWSMLEDNMVNLGNSKNSR
ncbi:carotenoid cleavage dioxygenase 7, chloroplastic [Nicotiana tomentosiformis]|uniref:Carotenoid cleavage dioxygenase 7 n=1 Tax=Nicotiana tabacum TaxID=4097 RepID=R9QMV6_TOBAC|nr:carotenoid cleavage dioxygenase 7, chloroplastic [Nicotiana tomentosiformis]AFU10970.1 carotenoid cleavage dioxygenase 7 [Nicotiana tabacum]